MQIFFVNTDAVSYSGVSRHDEWLRRNIVVTSGKSKYREALARIPVNALVLAYVKSLGVVAVGKVISDETLDVMPPETVNPKEQIEYHRAVSWHLDLRNEPISPAELTNLLGLVPRHAVQEVRHFKENLLRRLAHLEAVPTANIKTYRRVASELRKYGPVERPSGIQEPSRKSSQSTQYSRDPKVRAWSLQRAKGHCEMCGQPASFVDKYQEPYLETHHITMLANGGADTPENTAALCANCHRELHFGAERRAKTEKLQEIITTKESGTQLGASITKG